MIIKNLSIQIIFISIIIGFISNFGSNAEIVSYLTFLKLEIASYNNIGTYSFSETYYIYNEWWRLLTPMLLHFSFTHLAFNCLWIYILGLRIEEIDGKIIFLSLVIFSSILSNIAQYFFSESAFFGGLSGVVYGLIGFCMIREFEASKNIYEMPPALYLFMIIWLFLGFSGVLDLFGFGSVANFAHLGGLISGIIFAMMYLIIPVKKYD